MARPADTYRAARRNDCRRWVKHDRLSWLWAWATARKAFREGRLGWKP